MISCLYKFSILCPIQPCCARLFGGALPAEMIHTPTPAPSTPWKGFWTEDSRYILESVPKSVVRLTELLCVFWPCRQAAEPVFQEYSICHNICLWWIWRPPHDWSPIRGTSYSAASETDTWLWPWRRILPHPWSKVVSSISYKMAAAQSSFMSIYAILSMKFSTLYIKPPVF